MARKLTLTIIIANLISLVLLTGLLNSLSQVSKTTHLFIIPVFAILLFFSLVTKQVGRILSNLIYSAGLLIYLVILVQTTKNVYVTGLFISGAYAFIGTMIAIATSTAKKTKKVPMQQPPVPIQVYQQPEKVEEKKPVVKRATTKKKVAKKVVKKKTAKKSAKKKVAKKVVKKKTAKKSAKKKVAKKVVKKKTAKKPAKKKVAKKAVKKASAKKKVAKKTTKKAVKKTPQKKAATKKVVKKTTKNISTKGKKKTIQTDDGKQIVINIQN